MNEYRINFWGALIVSTQTEGVISGALVALAILNLIAPAVITGGQDER